MDQPGIWMQRDDVCRDRIVNASSESGRKGSIGPSVSKPPYQDGPTQPGLIAARLTRSTGVDRLSCGMNSPALEISRVSPGNECQRARKRKKPKREYRKMRNEVKQYATRNECVQKGVNSEHPQESKYEGQSAFWECHYRHIVEETYHCHCQQPRSNCKRKYQ